MAAPIDPVEIGADELAELAAIEPQVADNLGARPEPQPAVPVLVHHEGQVPAGVPPVQAAPQVFSCFFRLPTLFTPKIY